MQKPKLYVVGDSFSISYPDDADTWIKIAAQELGDLEIVNNSLIGSSQDWAWMNLHGWIESGMLTANDYIIVALTHPGRFWYFDDRPEFSNSNILDLDHWVSSERAKAIELFIKHIQRPRLDSLTLINRLGWLAYQVLKRGLNKPLIVKCFNQELFQFETNSELNVTSGNLYSDIQYWELEEPENDKESRFFNGLDCRYNHMCLSNHKILGSRVAQSLLTGNPLDVKEGYHKAILTPQCLDDIDFCQREINVPLLAEHRAKAPKSLIPWRKRAGLG